MCNYCVICWLSQVADFLGAALAVGVRQLYAFLFGQITIVDSVAKTKSVIEVVGGVAQESCHE